jgi:hypothetical protein
MGSERKELQGQFYIAELLLPEDFNVSPQDYMILVEARGLVPYRPLAHFSFWFAHFILFI